LIHRHVGVADDGRQEVVEVVRHAARQLTDGLHLLSLSQLGLEEPSLGYINGDGDGAHHFMLPREHG
jgi:hypothetical protein